MNSPVWRHGSSIIERSAPRWVSLYPPGSARRSASGLATRRRGEPQSVGMPVRGAECQTPSYSPPRAVAVGCAYGAKGDAYGVVGGAYDAEGDAYGAVGGAYDARAARMAPLVLVARMTPLVSVPCADCRCCCCCCFCCCSPAPFAVGSPLGSLFPYQPKVVSPVVVTSFVGIPSPPPLTCRRLGTYP